LGVERVGGGDNFFELGGHSLLATQVVSRIRASFGVDLPLRSLFEAPTVESLALLVDAAVRTGQGVQRPELVAQPRTGELPLSFAQQRLWFLEQLEPGLPTYHIPLAMRLEGTLDASALEHSIQELVRRHESLRTTFRPTGTEAVQVIHSNASLSLPLVDLSTLPQSQQEGEVRRLAEEEAQRAFDLIHGPLLRVKLLKLGETQHVLVLTMHHIVSDGWSMGVLIKEVAALYQAFALGQPSPLPELSLQYADYAAWQRNWLRGEALETQLAYWRQQLAQAPQVLELPTDRPRPPVQSHRGANLPVRLPPELSRAITTLGQREGATPFMVLLAAFQAVLSRYSGQRDISVGSPIAGRTHADTEGLIGFFVNTLVLRTRLEGNPSFRELLGRVRQVALGAYAHQDLPFEKLVEELKPQRSLSYSPLFQVMLVLQNTPVSVMAGSEGSRPSLEMHPLEVEGQTAKFDLTLSLSETPEGLIGSLQYNTDLFESATAARLLGHLQVLLEAATTNPELSLSALPLLPEAERQQMLVAWNDTQAERPWAGCIHELIEAQAARTPHAVAVVYEEGQLTFSELDRRANQLAQALRSRGVGPEVRVALCMERSLDMVVGVLGILKAGGAYVPMDPGYPSQRLAFMLQDSRARLVLTQQRLCQRLAPHGLEALALDGNVLSGESHSAPARLSEPGHLAYIIYTSGSTGLPKGVMIQHASVVNLRAALDETVYAGVEGALRVSVNAPLAFDGSVKQLIQLANGHALCVIPEEARADPRRMLGYLEKHRIQVLDCTPSLLRLMLEEGLGASGTWTPERVLVGGEAVDEATWATLSQHPRIACFNVYGPTECTVDATVRAVRGAPALPTIGRPLLNVRTYVLDERMEPTPVGVPGELYIGGAGLARGYHGRPELSAEKFVPNPFSTQPGARLYRTGDRVRYLAGGELEYLGRIDHQVKLRGFRIELGEIESALGQHPEVKQAAVLVRKDGNSPERLVAYVVAREGQKVEASALRAFLAEHLPEYMVPSVFLVMDALPLTTHGKVDRKALPVPEASGVTGPDFVPPRDTLEAMLVHVWEELLGVQPVGVRSNFFELGGHSLLAVSLMARIREFTGRSLPLTALFQEATIQHLAELLRREEEAGPWSPLVPLRRAGSARPFFLVHPVGGNVLCYAELARQLGPDQPLYALQAPGLKGEQPPLGTIEELAAYYVEAIRTVQPTGPYLLGGWSLGGVVAYELAQRFQRAGEQVELLALIDSSVRQADAPDEAEVSRIAMHFAWDLFRTAGMELQPPENLSELGPEALLEALLEQGRVAGLIAPGAEAQEFRALFRVFESNLRASFQYRPKPYTGTVTLLRASEPPLAEGEDADHGWSALAARVERHELPGDHYTLLQRPHVQKLAERLKECLAPALQAPGLIKGGRSA
jgi:amino acid adenylation domain-containing protein